MTTETEYGTWTGYGADGRLTTDADGDWRHWRSVQEAGTGWRARRLPNPLGGDYGWGPLAQTEDGAVGALEAEIGEADA